MMKKRILESNSREGIVAMGIVRVKQRSGKGHSVLGNWSGFPSGPRGTNEAKTFAKFYSPKLLALKLLLHPETLLWSLTLDWILFLYAFRTLWPYPNVVFHATCVFTCSYLTSSLSPYRTDFILATFVFLMPWTMLGRHSINFSWTKWIMQAFAE